MTFLDVGAHEGQTLAEAVRYEFDCIYAFEPMPAQFARLEERFGGMPHVELLNQGLADETGRQTIYGTNEQMEASVYPAKEDVASEVVTDCEFVEASEFFEDLSDGVFVKLNCEGSEVPIVNNLLDTGAISKVASLLVDFDVGHIPGMEDEERLLRKRLEGSGVDWQTSEDVVPSGRSLRLAGRYRYSRADEIMCWLKSHGIAER